MYRLVIVDDEFEIRNGLSRYFPWENVGFTAVAIFEGAQGAIEYIRKNPVDVVLSDIEMPGLSGIDLAREIHQQGLPVKVIFLSAYKKFEYAQEALAYKVRHYITKPTVYNEIFEVFCSVKKELDTERGTGKSREKSADGYYGKLVEQIKSTMAKDLKNASLISVAEQVGRSPSSVSRLFLEATGISFTDFLTSLRMEKANQLLDCIEYKIYEVSEMVGYTSPKNFARAYKKYFGHTPREYRAPKT